MTIPFDKLYDITNIKSYVPLILDLNKLNYDACREFFKNHCVAYKVFDHLDGTDPLIKIGVLLIPLSNNGFTVLSHNLLFNLFYYPMQRQLNYGRLLKISFVTTRKQMPLNSKSTEEHCYRRLHFYGVLHPHQIYF